ncbi:MAG: Hsp20/alpha crystallin family protein [Candidatus Geothermincolia bacterium]
MAKWFLVDPFKEFLDIHDEVNRLFRESIGEGRRRPLAAARGWVPSVDVYETRENLVVLVEVPGIKSEDVEISMQEGVLRVAGERRVAPGLKEENIHCIERDYGRFERRIALPHRVDEKGIKAGYAAGVLKIELPKVGTEAPRRIPILTDDAPETGE